MTYKTIHTRSGLVAMAQVEEMGTPDRIDALATVIGGVLMLGWLSYIAPILT